eukprot:Opistho-2@47451
MYTHELASGVSKIYTLKERNKNNFTESRSIHPGCSGQVLHLRNHLSIQILWYIQRQGSLAIVFPFSKGSRQIEHSTSPDMDDTRTSSLYPTQARGRHSARCRSNFANSLNVALHTGQATPFDGLLCIVIERSCPMGYPKKRASDL